MKEFVSLIDEVPVVDVRTESEYRNGHIPSAVSLPLFSDEERSEIGLIYKDMGRSKATRAGLEMVGPRLNGLVDDFRERVAPGRVLVHCWRGGMRSESVAWLVGLTGEYDAQTLRGGYKAYRNFALSQFAADRRLLILGGMTGSAKTDLLSDLQKAGAQCVDLERLAGHRGSAFGAIGQSDPPTQQQFENELAFELHRTDPRRVVWLEDESRHIGRKTIPNELWLKMRTAPVVVVEKPREVRVRHLVETYGEAARGDLIDSIQRIERRLGGDRAKAAIDAVQGNDLSGACRLILEYYDRTYRYGLEQRDPQSVVRVDAAGLSRDELVERLLEIGEQS